MGGGNTYSGASAGKHATGYGAGGGGAGMRDRSAPGTWAGGSGSNGLVQFWW